MTDQDFPVVPTKKPKTAKSKPEAHDAPVPEQMSEGRKYLKNMEIDSDNYKLEVAKMLKNAAIDEEEPDYSIEAEHVHFFNTYNSDGVAQVKCHDIGGHHHMMEVIQRPGKHPLVKCGPATKTVVVKKGKRFIREEHPVLGKNSDVQDNHVHKVRYLKSVKIQGREVNQEALKAQVHFESKGAPVPGINEER